MQKKIKLVNETSQYITKLFYRISKNNELLTKILHTSHDLFTSSNLSCFNDNMPKTKCITKLALNNESTMNC